MKALYNKIRGKIESGESLTSISADLGVSLHDVRKARAGIGRLDPDKLDEESKDILEKYVKGYSTRRLNGEGYDREKVKKIRLVYEDYIHDEHEAYMDSLYDLIKADLESGDYTSTEVAAKYDVKYEYVREIRESNGIEVYTGKLKKEDYEEILARVKSGETLESIATDFGVTKQAISIISIEHGERRWGPISEEEGLYIIDQYRQGVSINKLHKETGRGHSTLTKYLKDKGVYKAKKDYILDRDMEIISRYNQGERGVDLAEEYGLHPGTIYEIVNNRYS